MGTVLPKCCLREKWDLLIPHSITDQRYVRDRPLRCSILFFGSLLLSIFLFFFLLFLFLHFFLDLTENSASTLFKLFFGKHVLPVYQSVETLLHRNDSLARFVPSLQDVVDRLCVSFPPFLSFTNIVVSCTTPHGGKCSWEIVVLCSCESPCIRSKV